ncbi:MAG: hypothetical protein KF833_16595 [Verrucomicrobiae bacterium]|nr:hypothetical protein [Verrucomicrobiae bacterium]
MPGGCGFRRDGSTTKFDEVFFDPANSQDMACGVTAAVFPADRAARLALPRGTPGYPAVDSCRDFVLRMHTTLR